MSRTAFSWRMGPERNDPSGPPARNETDARMPPALGLVRCRKWVKIFRFYFQ